MVEVLTSIGGAEVYIAKADTYNPLIKTRVVMALHGNGRQARSYRNLSDDPLGVDFYAHQRDLALSSGALFCVISNGTDTWGTNAGLSRIVALHDYMTANYLVYPKFILWSTSAGGSQMHRFIKEYPTRVALALGTFPVYSLVDMIDVTANSTAVSVWGTGSAAISAGAEATEWPEALINVSMLIYHGIDDVTVPPEAHTVALADTVNALGGDVEYYIVTGGHSTTNWAVYDDVVIAAFLISYTENAGTITLDDGTTRYSIPYYNDYVLGGDGPVLSDDTGNYRLGTVASGGVAALDDGITRVQLEVL